MACRNYLTKRAIDYVFDSLPGQNSKVRKENLDSKRVLNDLKCLEKMNLVWEEEDRKELKKDIECLKWFLGE